MRGSCRTKESAAVGYACGVHQSYAVHPGTRRRCLLKGRRPHPGFYLSSYRRSHAPIARMCWSGTNGGWEALLLLLQMTHQGYCFLSSHLEHVLALTSKAEVIGVNCKLPPVVVQSPCAAQSRAMRGRPSRTKGTAADCPPGGKGRCLNSGESLVAQRSCASSPGHQNLQQPVGGGDTGGSESNEIKVPNSLPGKTAPPS